MPSSANDCQADIAVITIREDEQAAVVDRLQGRGYLECENRTYIVGDAPSSLDEHVYRVAVVASMEQGPGYAQKAAEDAIADLHPRWLALVGIAGAVPDNEFTLGDVVVAERVHDFSVSAVWQDESGQSHSANRDQGGPLSERVRNLAKLLQPLSSKEAKGWNDPDRIGVPRPAVDLSPSKFYGSDLWREKTKESLDGHFRPAARTAPLVTARSIASSGTLMKDAAIMQQFLDSSREIAAVEMELGGVYKAARRQDHEYPILAIRGISDVVGFKRDPGWTTYACHTAAAFFFALLRVMPPRFIGPRPTPT
jgi:nucleoside phosphorylase